MNYRFPLRPDDIWHSAMRERYGDAVPPIELLQFRRGLQTHVADMYEKLNDFDLLRHVNIMSIVTRNAGFTIIDARGHFGLPYGEYGMADSILASAGERLSESCEHCGKTG